MRILKPFKKSGKTGPAFWLLALGLLASPLVVAGFAGYHLFLKDAEKPQVALSPQAEAASLKRPFVVTASDDQSGIRSLTVTVAQGQRRTDVLRRVYDPPRDQVSERFSLEHSELRGGAFEIQIAAHDGSHANLGAGNAARINKRMLLDPVPPTIKAVTPAHYMRQGGAGLVVYDVNKDVARSGVMVGDRFFPGYKQKSGQYACLFAFPSDLDAEAYKPRLFVEDAAGNEKTGFFVNMAIKRRFREERVEITDEFLAARLPAFAAMFPQERDPVERFKKLNTELRRQNAAFIGSLAAKSGPVPLWDGGFIYLPRSVVRGSFGAARIVMYKGQEIGRELSDGIGLASVPGAQVPAANAGDVVFAGPLGVYGNTVVMDHGLGLLTVYANLGSIAVKVGDVLKKGEPVGTTGTTGLTPGDQVHFAVYLSGQPVIPIEWWDGHWIEDNITTKLRRYAAETPQP